MSYVLRYLEHPDEVLDQLEDLDSDPQWVADHPGETASDFAEGWAPLYVFDGTSLSFGGFDSAELAAHDGATMFITKKAAQAWIAADQGQPGVMGTFEIVEVEV